MKCNILYSFVVLLLISLLSTNAYSQNNNSNGISLTQTNEGYNLEFNLPHYNYSEVNQSGEIFTKINVANYGITPETGEPMLPQISFSIFINYDEQSPLVEVLDQSKDLKYLTSKISPTQAPWEKDKSLDDRPFTINRDYYSSKGSIDRPDIRISAPYIIAGVKGVTVTVFPFAYDPSANKLSVLTHGTFKIKLQYPVQNNNRIGSSFNGIFKDLFINYRSSSYTSTNNYLIITAPEYEAGMASFVSHKQNMGYNVFMANTGGTGTTTDAIKAFIQARYNNVNTRPEFILLVGDVDKVPSWTGGGSDNPNTDLNYTLLEGSDLFADAFIGRFSVSNLYELTNIINKSIYMETNINGLPKKNIFMASNDNYTVSEGTHNFVIDSFFGPGSYTNVKLYSHTYSATTQQLIDALNANQSFAIYSGHGSTNGWADGPVLNQSDVNSLTNTVFPFVYGFACVTGQYQVSECFAETWIRTQHGGAIYWGSSVNSFWDEDDILERRMVRSMFNDDLKKSAPMFVMGKYYLYQYYGSVTQTVQRYLEMYNCFGDPSIYEASFGPMISHPQLPNTENLNGPYVMNCTITPAGSSIDASKTKLLWTRGTNFADSVLLTNTGGNNWTANIPGNGTASTYRYYIKTCDALGRTCILPGGAPASYFSFRAEPDLTPPEITHTPLENVGQPMWPTRVICSAADNIGLDSVWVEWYRNIPSQIKSFKLSNTGGNVFSAMFNSLNSDVTVGDSIFYVIKAKDNSANHNTCSLPAAGYYKFGITSLTFSSFCKETWLPIRDNQTNYDTLYIPLQGVIVDFNFKMESLVHTYVGDVSFSIISPTGLEVVLSSNHGSSGENYTNTVFDDSAATPIANGTAPFTGTFRPDNPLNVFIGQSTHGNWVLKVNDNAGLDTGHVEKFCLMMQYNSLIGITENSIPRYFELKQNYPNPFNPVTKIKYSIPKQANVNLTVYDILGREVSKLVNEFKPAGNYEINFDGTNLASGVYFYRITAGDFTDIKKMVILK